MLQSHDQDPTTMPDARFHEGKQLLPGAGSAILFRHALSPPQAAATFTTLLRDLPWEQRELRIYGRLIPQPRLVAWFGDTEATYTYSGLTLQPRPWPAAMGELRKVCERLAGESFNSGLANLYRNGRDGVSWHSDDEPELGPDPLIASLSLGAERRFDLRNKTTGETVKTVLPSGSVVVMSNGCQQNWLHQVPKTARVTEPRVNITFRRRLRE